MERTLLTEEIRRRLARQGKSKAEINAMFHFHNEIQRIGTQILIERRREGKSQAIDPPAPAQESDPVQCSGTIYTQQGDEKVCPRCFIRWGNDEERPPCREVAT